MHFAAVLLVMFLLPSASVLAEKLVFQSTTGWMSLTGRWFVFWAVGVGLLLAGVMQVVRPDFTSKRIFEVADPSVSGIVREVASATSPSARSAWLVSSAKVGSCRRQWQ